MTLVGPHGTLGANSGPWAMLSASRLPLVSPRVTLASGTVAANALEVVISANSRTARVEGTPGVIAHHSSSW